MWLCEGIIVADASCPPGHHPSLVPALPAAGTARGSRHAEAVMPEYLHLLLTRRAVHGACDDPGPAGAATRAHAPKKTAPPTRSTERAARTDRPGPSPRSSGTPVIL